MYANIEQAMIYARFDFEHGSGSFVPNYMKVGGYEGWDIVPTRGARGLMLPEYGNIIFIRGIIPLGEEAVRRIVKGHSDLINWFTPLMQTNFDDRDLLAKISPRGTDRINIEVRVPATLEEIRELKEYKGAFEYTDFGLRVCDSISDFVRILSNGQYMCLL